MSDQTAKLDEQALAEALHQWEHGDRNPVAVIRSYLSALPAVPPSGGSEDFEAWYNRTFKGYAVDTKHIADCEEAFLAGRALRPAVPEKPQEAVAWGIFDETGWVDAEKTQGSAEKEAQYYDQHFASDTPHRVAPLYAHPVSPALVGDESFPPQGSLVDDILTVCKAFDDGLFVRSTQNDTDDAWQMKFIGPLSALARLSYFATTDAYEGIAEALRDRALLDRMNDEYRGVEIITGDDEKGDPTRRFFALDGVLPDAWRDNIRDAIEVGFQRYPICQSSEVKCRTDGCDGDPDDGEGWDGYCGNCADKREGERHV